MFLNFTNARITAILIWAFFVGISLGIFYDIIRIMRIARKILRNQNKKISRFGKIGSFFLVFFEDIFFCSVVAIVSILFIFTTNNGQIRIFALICELTGFIVYHFTLGILVMKISEKLINFIKWMAIWISKHIIIPPIKFIANFIAKIWKNIYNRLKLCIVKNKQKRRLLQIKRFTKKKIPEIMQSAAKGFK